MFSIIEGVMNTSKYLLLPLTAVVMSAVGLTDSKPVMVKPLENKPSESFTCPYYAPTSSSDSVNAEDPSIPIYKHCSHCNIGAILGHEDGIDKCSYCGKTE
jgi:hypothetical protein